MFKVSDLYYRISPFSLAAIVVLNFLLIYMNLVNLENQTLILQDIAKNTEIALQNQELGLNATKTNQHMLEQIIALEAKANQTVQRLADLDLHAQQTNDTLRNLNISQFQ